MMLGSVNQAGWECAIECNWKRISECAWEYASEHLVSLLGRVQSSKLGVCHPVQLEASMRACPGVNLRTYSEECFGVYSECTCERLECVSHAGWECSSERTWESAKKYIWQFGFKFV
jgi:hypothetical protein